MTDKDLEQLAAEVKVSAAINSEVVERVIADLQKLREAVRAIEPVRTIDPFFRPTAAMPQAAWSYLETLARTGR